MVESTSYDNATVIRVSTTQRQMTGLYLPYSSLSSELTILEEGNFVGMFFIFSVVFFLVIHQQGSQRYHTEDDRMWEIRVPASLGG